MLVDQFLQSRRCFSTAENHAVQRLTTERDAVVAIAQRQLRRQAVDRRADRLVHAASDFRILLLCAAVASDPTALRDQEVDRLCTELFLTTTAQDTDDNLAIVRNRLLRSEGDLMALLTLYGQVRAGKSVKDEETNPLCSVLKLSGITRVERGALRVRNRIYVQVFDREWITTNLPGAEVRRQQAAYPSTC